MAERVPKTIAELSRVIGANFKTRKELGEYLNELGPEDFKKVIAQISKIYQVEEDRLKVIEKINDVYLDYLNLTKDSKKEESEVYRILKDQLDNLNESLEVKKQITQQSEKYGKVLTDVADKALTKILQQNQEIFKTAKDLQLQSNLTWKQYTEIYEGAFQATRQLNKEVGQSIANAREMIETQNFLLQGGFRGINLADVTNMSASALMLTRTLGDFPNELLITFQRSYRQFGSQNDEFITQMGNRLNAFSNTFGVQVSMLTQTVASMSAENAFLFRNNMAARTRADESLMRAAALSGAMNLSSAAFISDLASTSQFGTMQEMAGIFQGGALLQGFDTRQFQQMMIGGQADSAIEMLFSSIGQTIGSIEDQYLRAEYMQQIGGAFGLSRDDILDITSNSGNLEKIMEELRDKTIDVDDSMLDELSGLKMSLVDRAENWWVSTKSSEGISKVLQDLGLVGVSGSLKYISTVLTTIAGKQFNVGSLVGNMLTGGGGGGVLGGFQGLGNLDGGKLTLANAPWTSGTAAKGMSGMARLGLGAGGAALGIGSNIAGRSIQMNTNMSNTSANVLGGATNVLGGVFGGAMLGQALIPVPLVGAAIGAGVGAIAGGINTYIGAQERKSAMQEMEDQQRQAARNRLQASSQTGDPVVDAINNMNANLTTVLNGNFSESIKMSFVLDTANRTSAGN